MAVIQNLVVRFTADTTAFDRGTKRARKSLYGLQTESNKTQKALLGIARGAAAFVGVGAGIYAVKSVLTSSVQAFADFEKGIANISTLLDDQGKRLLPTYENQIRRMSREFGESTETLSKGLYDIVSASVAPAKALSVLEVSVKAAKAGISDTATAADALTTILNSYGYEAERAGRISDILFTTIKRGKTTFSELAPNIGKVTSLAATAGLSFEELSAALATMTRAGVQTEIAITSLRALILSFLKPQNDSIEAARKYGIELNSNTLKTEGLTGVIKKLQSATAEELATIIPTSRAIAGFAAAIKNAGGNADDYNAILNSLGETEKAYQEIASTTAFALDTLKQNWLDFKRTIGEEVAPVLNELIPILNKIISSLDEIGGFLYSSLSGVNGLSTYYIKIAAEREKARKLLEQSNQSVPTKIPSAAANEPFGGYQYLTPELPGFDSADLKRRIKAHQDEMDARVEIHARGMEEIVRIETEAEMIMADFRERTRQDMIHFWDPIIDQSMTAREAVDAFFRNFAIQLAQAAAQSAMANLFAGLGINALFRAPNFSTIYSNAGVPPNRSVVGFHSGRVPSDLPSFHAGSGGGRPLRNDEMVALIKKDELIAPSDQVITAGQGGLGTSAIENKLDALINIMSRRQILNATIVDKRDVVTDQDMEGRKGEKFVLNHIRRNS